jgi:hypothetical protein
VFVKILYVLLVLSTLALLWAVGAAYLRVRRRMSESEPASLKSETAEQERKKAVGED